MTTLLADTWLLITLRWQIAWNGFMARKPAAKVLYVLGMLTIAGFAVFFSGGAGFVAGAALRQFPEAKLDTILPGLVITGTTLLILISSFGVALGSLFLSS